MTIVFGTDGWRGVIARDFTFDNVRLVAYATAKHILNHYKDVEYPSVVVGYDTRFLSRDFAEETAAILASQGITVHLTDSVSSTPQVSFHTKQKGSQLGVVITASHNPPKYNGFKLKGSFGGPATTDEIAMVENELKSIMKKPPQLDLKTLDEYIEQKKIRLFNAKESYIRQIKKKVDMQAVNAANFKILYDPMYGAGIDTIHLLLPDADVIHNEYNPSFGELHHPEPIAENLYILAEKVKEGKYDIGIATDGDADRVGLIDNEGNFVDSHRVFMILLKYLYEQKKKRGTVVKTVSLTSMVDKYCKAKNLPLVETPVGFKHTAKIMNETKVLIGGEESGGLGTILHIPERDGLFNAMLILEVMAVRGKSLKELSAELDEELGTHKYHRRDARVTPDRKKAILAAAQKLPEKIGPFAVESINTLDGYKFYIDGGWLLIRASGTEPLIRFYAEADSMSKVNELLDAGMKLK